jgi:hypothetical protein
MQTPIQADLSYWSEFQAYELEVIKACCEKLDADRKRNHSLGRPRGATLDTVRDEFIARAIFLHRKRSDL